MAQLAEVPLEPARARRIVWLLALSVGLMQTGFGVIYPVFARRLSEFGSGVEALGLMVTAFAAAQFLLAPLAGSLADRFGRRPLILIGLAGFAVSNLGFLLARSVPAFIAVRVAEGCLVAGLFPSATAAVADIFPEEKRAQWVGILMGCSMAGFIFGPTLGGFLYDQGGFAMPFVVSAALGFAALAGALLLLPETHRRARRPPPAETPPAAGAPRVSVWASLPRPLYLFGLLLFFDFTVMFTFAFSEPQMVFYFYDDLGWATTRFGEVIGVYGLALALTQGGLGRLADRLGRRLPIQLGLWLLSTFYFSLAFSDSFPVILFFAALSGLGEGLYVPAVSALLLDMTPAQHRSRVMGIKGSSSALAGVVGPLIVAGVSQFTTAYGVFLIAGALSVAAAVISMFVLRGARRPAASYG